MSLHPDLPGCAADAKRVGQFFQDWGFVLSSDPEDLSAADAGTIRDAVERWSDSLRSAGVYGALVLYLGGHGRMHHGRHHILAATSPSSPPYGGSKSISADDLVEQVLNSGAKRALILLDVCHAGFAAAEVQQSVARAAAAQAGPIMDIAVLVSCLHHEKSYSGAFVGALLRGLEEGSAQGHWKDGDEYVTPQELRDELRDRLQDEQCAEVAGRSGLKIVLNPRYRADAAARSAEIGELLRHLAPADREHFLRKAASTDAIDVGWFFTGRRRPSQHAVEWLGEARQGVLVVTGAPGAGKSAFLGRLAVLADRDSQAACRALGMLDTSADTRPPVGVFDAVTHLKNRRVDDVAQDIARQLDIDLRSSSSPARDLVVALADSAREVTVLADALDEAERGEEEFVARDVLRAIGSLDGCRVVVGTRRDRDGRHDSTPDDPGPLVSALRPRGGLFRILDLSADPATEDDIAQYVAERLAEKWPTQQRRERAAREVAAQSARVFLYGRFALRVLEGLPETVVEQPGWQDRLPSDVGAAGLHEVFSEDLQRFGDPIAVREVLTPLAFARGAGLPRRQVWPALATELSVSGRAYRDSDISRIIREAGWYLTEATEDGQAVFRLYHQAIADYLAQGCAMRSKTDVEAAITQRLRQLAEVDGWRNANPYTVHYLALHARSGGELTRLASDVGYLVAADPVVLAGALGTGLDPDLPDGARTLLRCAHDLRAHRSGERAATLVLTALQQGERLNLDQPVDARWWCRWARSRPTAYHRVLEGHIGPVYAVAVGDLDGQPIVLTGSGDATARVWDLRTGASLRVLEGHTSGVNAVVLGDLDGEPVLLTGSGDATVRMWNPRNGNLVRVLEGHTFGVRSIALGHLDTTPVCVTGSDDASVRIWDLRTGTALRVLQGHKYGVRSVALGTVDGTPIIVTGNHDATVRVWDARRGEELLTLTGHEGPVRTVALSVLDGTPVAVTGGAGPRMLVWDLRTGAQRHDLVGHLYGVNSVVLSELDNAPVALTGGDDGDVRLSDLRTGAPLRILEGHRLRVRSVALGHIDDVPVAVTGSYDRTVRVWDLVHSSALPSEEGQLNWVRAVALGEADGTPVAVTGGHDGTARLWDLSDGRALRTLSGHTDWVRSVALGELDGVPIALTAGDDTTARVWNLRDGTTIRVMRGHTDWVRSVALGELDGAPIVLSGGDDATARVWNLRDGRNIRVLYGHSGPVYGASLGRLDDLPVALTGGHDGTARLWDLRDGRPLRTLSGHTDWVRSVALGELDGVPIALTAGDDTTACIWNLRDGLLLRTLQGHSGAIHAAALGDLDGAPFAVTGGRDRTVRVWSLAEGETGHYTIPLAGCTGIAVDGQLLAMTNDHGVAALTLHPDDDG